MAKEIKEQVEEISVEETEVEETKVEETPEQKKEGILEKIGSFLKGGTKEETKTVPSDFVAAANEAGWTDEQIEDFSADHEDEELIDMIPYLSEAVEKKEEVAETKTETKETKEKPKDKSQDDNQIKELLEKVNKLEEKLGEVDKTTAEATKTNQVKRVNQLFDEAGKEFEIFGATEKLPKFPDGRLVPTSPSVKARSEVWEDMKVFIGAGQSVDDAMHKALAIYRGLHLTKDVKRNMIKDLRRSEKSLSAKRSNNESINSPKYGPDVVGQILEKQGIV